MPGIRLPGTEVEGAPKKSLSPLLLVGVGAIALVFLMRKGGSNGGSAAVQMPLQFAPPADTSGQTELARITTEAATQLAQLTAGSRLEERRIAAAEKVALANTPAGLRSCTPWPRWWGMTAAQTKTITDQVVQGKVLLVPSAEGMCIVPTATGARGSEPLVTSESKKGFLSSKQKTVGPAGSYQPYSGPAPSTGVTDIFKSALEAFNIYAQSGGISQGGDIVYT